MLPPFPLTFFQEIFEETVRKQGLKITSKQDHIPHKGYELMP